MASTGTRVPTKTGAPPMISGSLWTTGSVRSSMATAAPEGKSSSGYSDAAMADPFDSTPAPYAICTGAGAPVVLGSSAAAST